MPQINRFWRWNSMKQVGKLNEENNIRWRSTKLSTDYFCFINHLQEFANNIIILLTIIVCKLLVGLENKNLTKINNQWLIWCNVAFHYFANANKIGYQQRFNRAPNELCDIHLRELSTLLIFYLCKKKKKCSSQSSSRVIESNLHFPVRLKG